MNRKTCKICGISIIRTQGRQYCIICSRVARLRRNRLSRELAQGEMSLAKELTGCFMCGYNKCGAAIDFHHVEDRSFRISATTFRGMTKRVEEELKKCILLCANCHRESHHE